VPNPCITIQHAPTPCHLHHPPPHHLHAQPPPHSDSLRITAESRVGVATQTNDAALPITRMHAGRPTFFGACSPGRPDVRCARTRLRDGLGGQIELSASTLLSSSPGLAAGLFVNTSVYILGACPGASYVVGRRPFSTNATPLPRRAQDSAGRAHTRGYCTFVVPRLGALPISPVYVSPSPSPLPLTRALLSTLVGDATVEGRGQLQQQHNLGRWSASVRPDSNTASDSPASPPAAR
jgi:hypothetical protein